MHSSYSVAIPASVNASMAEHLIRTDREEDLLFALWYPSIGESRLTALVHTPIFPEHGDRQRHGNASFNPQYLERVCQLAMKNNAGVAFLHSHPVPGWQSMSPDDIAAENKMMGSIYSLTDLPLLGMTTGSDGTWSARFWQHITGKEFQRFWCESVSVVGKNLTAHFNDDILLPPEYQEELKRTISVWSDQHHSTLARMRIGIVGLGSVGSFVAELLARMGFTRISLIDFDRIKKHNLDRTLHATQADIGQLKISVIKRAIEKSATAKNFDIREIPYSIAEENGYRAALDCDVLFSCVDRPRARRILNHFAYAHLIPVIDGGIQVRFKDGVFSGVDWQLQSVCPEKVCLECLGAYKSSDVSTEIEGKLDDPSYIEGLPETHRFKSNENVIPFSANLASLEINQLIALVTGTGGIDDFGVQRFRYNPGILEQDLEKKCHHDCIHSTLIARGDTEFSLFGVDHAAAISRR